MAAKTNPQTQACPAFADDNAGPLAVLDVNESDCSDARDCPSGTYCASSYNKGTYQTLTSCDSPDRMPYGGGWLCHADCDCPTGSCMNGSCR